MLSRRPLLGPFFCIANRLALYRKPLFVGISRMPPVWDALSEGNEMRAASSAMRIVAWNCNMALHKKYEHLLALRPDVAAIPECAQTGLTRRKRRSNKLRARSHFVRLRFGLAVDEFHPKADMVETSGLIRIGECADGRTVAPAMG